MKTNFDVLTKLGATAQSILRLFELQPRLLDTSDEAVLLNKHAQTIALDAPFALLKEIKPSGSTVWEDGVASTVEVSCGNN